MNAENDAALDRIMEQVREYGLEHHLLELESQGFTTLKQVLKPETVERAKSVIVETIERRQSCSVDLETGEGFAGVNYIPYLLYEDEIFEEILMTPAPLTLMTYLLGESCLLSSIGCHFKGPGGHPLALHSDNGNGMPGPFPAYAQVANLNYALTPYSKEAGALAMVPGSHKLARQPTVSEMQLAGERVNKHAVPMELEPGDCVIWHGNTWHGSYRREVPGVRMNLAVYFCRQYLQTQEQHKGIVPESVLVRQANSDRFQTLVGAKQPYGWQADGPDYNVMARNPKGLYD